MLKFENLSNFVLQLTENTEMWIMLYILIELKNRYT